MFFKRFILLSVLWLSFSCGPSESETIPTSLPIPSETPISPTAIPTITALPPDTRRMPWWNERVFYEIFVRSFYDSDGDGVGDFQGLISQLDYLNDGDPNTSDDLGITGIWLMPINASPSYHGYDVVDYYDVTADYGTLDDFKALLEAAHARDIVVIMDLVVNHTSVNHPWFQASKANEPEFADWYRWTADKPGYKGPWGQDVWHPAGERYYYGLFWDGMPDLNYENPAVSAEMFQVASFWLGEVGLDGFRLDAIKHIDEDDTLLENTEETHIWLQDFHKHVQTVAPNSFTVGEAWTITSQAVQYVGDEVDVVFEFDLAEAMLSAIRGSNSQTLYSVQKQVLDNYPKGQYATFLTNHDQNRVMSQIRDDIPAAKLGASLLLTGPGVPFIYYGEEIGMLGTKPDERIRTPMQWTADSNTAGFSAGKRVWEPLQDKLDIYNVAAQTDDPDSLLNHYRQMIQLRHEHSALRMGDTYLLESDKRAVYAVLRHSNEESIMIVINLTKREIDDYALSLPEGPLKSVSNIELLFGAGDIANPTINEAGGFEAYLPLPVLAPQGVMIFSLK